MAYERTLGHMFRSSPDRVLLGGTVGTLRPSTSTVITVAKIPSVNASTRLLPSPRIEAAKPTVLSFQRALDRLEPRATQENVEFLGRPRISGGQKLSRQCYREGDRQFALIHQGRENRESSCSLKLIVRCQGLSCWLAHCSLSWLLLWRRKCILTIGSLRP